MTEEESDTNESIASVVSSRIDYSSVAFATNNGVCILHLSNDIDFAHGCSIVLLAVLGCHVAKGACRTKVAHRIAWSVLQYIVGHSNKRVLLAVHSAIFADESKTVNVRVDNERYVVLTLCHKRHDVAEVLLKRFWIVLEIACRFCKKRSDGLHAKLLKQLWQDDTAY